MGGLLGGKDPTGRFCLLLQSSSFQTHVGAPHGSRQRDHFPTGPRAQGPQRNQGQAVRQKPDRAIGHGEVSSARMLAAKRIDSFIRLGRRAGGTDLVVDGKCTTLY